MAMNKDTVATVWWLLFIAVVIIMAAIFLYPRYQKKNSLYDKLRHRERVLAEKEQKRDDIQKEIRDLETSPEAVEGVAREKFGMSRSGEKILMYHSEDGDEKEK